MLGALRDLLLLLLVLEEEEEEPRLVLVPRQRTQRQQQQRRGEMSKFSGFFLESIQGCHRQVDAKANCLKRQLCRKIAYFGDNMASWTN